MAGRHFKSDSADASTAPASAPRPASPRGAQANSPRAQAAPNRAANAPTSDTAQFTAFASGASKTRSSQSSGRQRVGVTGQFPAQGHKVDFYDFGTPDDSNKKELVVRKKRKKHRKRAIIIVLILILVLAGAAGACGLTLYRSAKSVKADASSAISVAQGLPDKILAGQDVTADANQIASLASGMNEQLSSPLWEVASSVPAIGNDIKAARELVAVFDDMATNALTPMAQDLAANPIQGLVQNGALNAQGLQTLVNTTGKVASVIHQDNQRVQAIGNTNIAQVTELVEKAKAGFASLDSASTTAEKIAPVLPQMLGVGSPRNYLIVAENNAEIRTLGGFSGASGVLTLDNGKIHLNGFESTQTLGSSGGPTSKITISNEEMQLFQPYGTTLNYTAGDSFFIPDFPRGSELTRVIWSINHSGQMVDGVIAADPIFLQYLLQVVGGVTAVDGTQVDGTNAAKALLSDVYWKYPKDGKMQDAVFASVASAAFEKLTNNLGSISLTKLGASISRGISEGRLLAWSQNEDEETIFKEIGIAGELPTDPAKPQTGVYVNNYSFSKLDYYLNLNATKGQAIENGDGTTTYAITVQMENTMTADEEANIPEYVKAHNGSAQSSGQEILYLYLYAPAGGSVSNVSLSNGGSLREGTHNGLKVMYNEVRLKPGEKLTVTYNVTVPAEGKGKDLAVKVTPTAQAARDGSAAKPAEETATQQ